MSSSYSSYKRGSQDGLRLDRSGFPNPFDLDSLSLLPEDFYSLLRMCPMLWLRNPVYRQATKRLIGCFVNNKLVYGKASGSKKEQEALTKILEESLDIYGCLNVMGEEWGVYGNSFWRIHMPFTRSLIDTRNGKRDWSLSLFPESMVSYNYEKMTFTVPDPQQMMRGIRIEDCDKVELHFMDTPSRDVTKMALRKVNPLQIYTKYAEASGAMAYTWRLDDQMVADVKAGMLWQIKATPRDMLETIAKNGDFLFTEDHLFHFKAPVISGVTMQGWGLPEVVANYSNLHQVQVYKHMDEAVAKGYTIPMRMMAPDMGGTNGGPVDYINLAALKQQIEMMVRQHRYDPHKVYTLPYPVHYQESNSSGKSLAPTDHVRLHNEELLNGMGYPAELFTASLNVQQYQPTMRIMENAFYFIPRGMDRFIQWVARRVATHLGNDVILPSMAKSSFVNDLEIRQILMNLASAGEVSRREAWQSLGLEDPIASAKERGEEDLAIQEDAEKMQQEYQQKIMSGTLGQNSEEDMAAQAANGGYYGSSPVSTSGAMGSPPPGQQLDPLQQLQQAEQEAANLLQMEEGERRQRLNQIRAGNEVFHDLVMGRMRKLRGEGESIGRANAIQLIQQG